MILSEARLRQIVVEEIANHLAVRERRLYEGLIKEEIELYLLQEELVRLNEVLLNEGIMSWLNNLFLGDEERWKEIVDGAAAGKPPEEVVPDKQLFLSMPTKRRMATLALIATVFAGGMDFATKYYDVSTMAAQSAQMINDTMEDAKDRAGDISDFRQMAAADAEHGGANTPDEVQQALDDIRNEYQIEKSELKGGPGLMAGGEPATGFAYVPADQIDDSTVLPMTGMTKGDFETLLRLQWLSADAEGDQRLQDYVMGGDRPGSSAFWSYQDSLYAPVADATADPETKELMTNMYGEGAETTLLLPLEWSVAYDILQQRQGAGRI